MRTLRRLRAWWIRLLNRLPRRHALIVRIADQEWEQQRIVDAVLRTHRYEPGAWWRLSGGRA